ncbi:MAG: prephenate dehydrogenase [Bacteroidales bacterium]
MKTITIIGTGLTGCSFGLALRKQGHFVIGCDKSKKNLEVAKQINAIDATSQSISLAVKQSTVVILAIPVDAIVEMLPSVLDVIPKTGVVIDVGSTKESICQSIQHHPKRSQFIAAHPMAGSEQCGPAAARADLFNEKKVVICERERSNRNSLDAAKDLFNQMGMGTIYLSPTQHDDTVALVSHIPQLLAYAYAGMNDFNTIDENWESIASSGFDSVTRLAASPPEVWRPILKQNNQHLIKRLRSLSWTLNKIADEFHHEANPNIEIILNRAKRTRQTFENKQSEILNNTESNLTK